MTRTDRIVTVLDPDQSEGQRGRVYPSREGEYVFRLMTLGPPARTVDSTEEDWHAARSE